MSDWKCVHGHDRCDQMYPGPDCPYCERIPRRRKESDAVATVREKECEACAKLIDDYRANHGGATGPELEVIAAAIRARKLL
jgi:hypothetical protein